ncbi:MAG TPA: NAD(P)H-dependent glycerol-3-phosphate dehydrogenase [Gammaproteobacteria bacterium]|nr:NAD(P)H-dependent glycerol-3-phosphate dehydrogenase [Gammaproteobacteria bacterium]
MKKIQSQPIAVLGAGSWGTALALHLSRQKQTVHLWEYNKDQAKTLQKERVNTRFMPGFHFPDTLQVFADLKEAVAGLQDILIAVPSKAFYEVLQKLKPLLSSSARILWATKGLDEKNCQLLHEVALSVLGKERAYAVLSGPSFAQEVAAGMPTAVVIASEDDAFIEDLLTRFNSNIFRVYSSRDMVGVEVGGVVKNVLAIATGISDGMKFGTNARSALITRGLAEMMRFGIALGGQAETFTGLSGVGDLVLTCTDNQSRNRRFGLALGEGKDLIEAEREIGQVVEGKRNAELIVRLAKNHQVEMPITEGIWEIFSGKITAVEAMRQLLAREPKTEY